MSIKDDIYNGLESLPRTYSINNELDTRGWALITLPYPNAPHPLHEDELTLQLRIDSTERYASFYSPLAILHEGDKSSVYEHLLRRNFYAEQIDGFTFAIHQEQEHDVLQAVYHILESEISPDEFPNLIETMFQNLFTVINEVDDLANQSDLIQPINQ